jgi:P27 family predicted phage terminase small subunit
MIPPCPRFLSRVARQEWRRIAPELYVLGLLSELDRAALALYCEWWATWVEAETHLQKEGRMQITKNGYEQPSPWLSVARHAAEQVRVMSNEFGMTPASCSKVTAIEMPAKKGALAKYLPQSEQDRWADFQKDHEKESRFFGPEPA